MIVETTRGPMDDSAMEVTIATVDNAEAFQVVRDLKVPGSTETYRQVLGGFEKRNPFEAPRGRITVDFQDGAGIQEMEEADLDKTVGGVDDAREFTCWVECRVRGTGQLVHRSVDVKLKTMVDRGVAIAGSFGS